MLESVKGKVLSIGESSISFEVGPFTLDLMAPGYFLRRIVPGFSGKLHLLFQIQNDGNRGVPMAVAFPSPEDREFFTKFISVSGIGMRAAARAMVIPPGELASAIAAGDLKVLRSLPGIGNSRAKQIVAKLQDSFKGAEYRVMDTSEPGNASDARAILEQLGLPAAEAASLVAAAVDETGVDASPSDIVRAAMKARK